MGRAALGCLLLVALPGAARASTVRVVAAGCPGGDEVAAALRPLLARSQVLGGADPTPADVELHVEDLGTSYRVSLPGVARSLVDAGRSCADRAREAAVFAALTLEPPVVEGRAAVVERAAPRATSGGARDLRVELEAAATLAAAPASSSATDGVLAGGGSLRLFVGWRFVGAALGASGLSPDTVRYPAGQVELVRVPLDLSLRALLRRGRFEGVLDVGGVLAVVSVRGLDLPLPRQATQVEAGVRVALAVRLWAGSRVAPFVAIEGQWVPGPVNLRVEPAGSIGATPLAWLGVSLGAALRAR